MDLGNTLLPYYCFYAVLQGQSSRIGVSKRFGIAVSKFGVSMGGQKPKFKGKSLVH